MDKQGRQVCWVDARLITADGAQSDAADMITLEKTAGGYRLLAGGDKLASCLKSGRTQVEAVIRPSMKLEARLGALLARMAESKLHFLSEAEAYKALIEDEGLSVRELSERLGKSQSAISRKLRLLTMSKGTRQAVIDGRLSEQQALMLLRIPGEEGRLRMAKHIAKEGLNAAQAERLISQTLSRMPIPVPAERRFMPLMRDYRLYLNAFKGIVEQMQSAGLDAVMTLNKGVSIVELRVTVPIFKSRSVRQG